MIDNRVIKLHYMLDDENSICTLEIVRFNNINKYAESYESPRLQRISNVLVNMEKEGKIVVDRINEEGSIILGDWSFYIYYPQE